MPTSKIKLYIDIITVNAAKILGKDSVIVPYTFQTICTGTQIARLKS
jgi:hypothetical protein